MITLHDFGGVLGNGLWTLSLGSHNFMVTALGSCEVALSTSLQMLRHFSDLTLFLAFLFYFSFSFSFMSVYSSIGLGKGAHISFIKH